MDDDSKEACQHRWTTYKTAIAEDGLTRIRKQKCLKCDERRKLSIPVEFAPPRNYLNPGSKTIPAIVEQTAENPTVE